MGTDFFLGGSLAVLLALLGWGDQIRGTQEKSRLLESEFLRRYKFRWGDLQPLVRPDSSDSAEKRLASIIRLLKGGALTRKVDQSLLTNLETLNQIRIRLEPLYAFRFKLIFFLSFQMFIAGVLSIFLTGTVIIPLPQGSIYYWFESWEYCTLLFTWTHVWTTTWLLLLAAVLWKTWEINIDEEKFRSALEIVDDQLRHASDEIDEEAK